MGVKKLPSGNWRLQIRRKNLRVDESYPSEQEANQALEKYTGGVVKGTGKVSLDDAWALYEKCLAFVSKKENTRNTEISRIKSVLRKLGRRPVADISSELVEEYITGRLSQDPQPSADSIRLEVAALSALMTFCRGRHLVAVNPCIGVKRPAPVRTLKRLKSEDEGTLISLLVHLNPRFRFVARLCLLVRETGARPGEWVKACFDDIDFKKRTVIFPDTKYKGMPRTVPLTAAAEHLLAAQLEDVLINNFETYGSTEYVFPVIGKDGRIKPMHYSGALRDMKKHALLPKRVKAHIGRHEFISTLVESTELDDSRIMSLVGHHSPSSMEIYKHVRNVRFRPQIEEIEPERRSGRVSALSTALNLPPKIIEMLLLNERDDQLALGKPDDGEELLYNTEFVEKVADLARQLGATPQSRLDAIARLRAIRIANPGGSAVAEPSASGTLTEALEVASIGSRIIALDTSRLPEDGAIVPAARKSARRKSTGKVRGKI